MSNNILSIKSKFADIFFLIILTVFLYGIVLFFNKIIPNIDHRTHYLWLTQFYAAIESGEWYPRWMPMAQLGIGEAHYSAYLLYYYIATALMMITGFDAWTSIKLMVVFSTLFGAIIIYFQFLKHLGRNIALIAAIFWILSPFPFFLFTNYGALPWNFSLFLAIEFVILSLLPTGNFYRVKIAAIAVLLMFSHVLVAFMVFLSMGLTLLYRSISNKNTWKQLIWFWILPLISAVMIVSFHYVPTLEVQSLLGIDAGNTNVYINWKNSFIFPTFSAIFWGMRWFAFQWIYPGVELASALVCIFILLKFRSNKDKLWNFLFGLVLFICIGLILGSELSFPLYYFNTPFRSLQWGYRFVTIGAVGVALAMPVALAICFRSNEKNHFAKYLTLMTMMLSFTLLLLLQVQLALEGRDPKLTSTLLSGEFHQEGNQFATTGTKWREYVQSGGLRARCQNLNAVCTEEKSTTQHRVWQVKSTKPENIIFPLFAFPAWVVRINDVKVPFEIDKDTGLIDVAVPAGNNLVEIELGDMPLSRLGRLVSGAGLFLLLMLMVADWRQFKNSKSHKPELISPI